MTCLNCTERRDKLRAAFVEAKIAEAVKQAALGLGEMVGVVKKKGDGDGG